MKSKILVVEDNITDLIALKRILDQENYDIINCLKGEETFALLEKDKPDMVILDIVLPDMDGFEVCRRIRKDDRYLSLPILFYSTIRTIDEKYLGLEMGASDFISKSCEPRELLVRIKNLLSAKKKLDEVIGLSFHDMITKIYNRNYFEHRLHDEFERSKRFKRDFSCMIIDVDNFKKINFTFGRDTGDVLLKRIAAVVKENTRVVDEVCRYGADEFGIILPETDLRDAYMVGERVRQVIINSNTGRTVCTVDVTVSCGISSYTKEAADMQDLINQANTALTKAKQDGQNRTIYYSKQLGDSSFSNF